ncbi:hypothetical protein D3C75_1153970 [compost metagenome]
MQESDLTAQIRVLLLQCLRTLAIAQRGGMLLGSLDEFGHFLGGLFSRLAGRLRTPLLGGEQLLDFRQLANRLGGLLRGG